MFSKRKTTDITAFGTELPFSPQAADGVRRAGYSLIEVMIAVSLTLVLMTAIASIFSQVGSLMTQTQHILEMTNNLRTTKDRLLNDLENLTVPELKAPSSKYGFFSYVEGVGPNLKNHVGPLAGNFDRNKTNSEYDATAGDSDDILSFTVRAPAGKWFRGRCFKENYDENADIDDNIEMIESEYAEVIWFLRGTTLYRRVLLIIPDDVLEARMTKLNQYLAYRYPDLATPQQVPLPFLPEEKFLLPKNGFGFFRYFDVSVHFDANKSWTWNGFSQTGRIVANTLSDLANRSCRFGYWSAATDDVLISNLPTEIMMNTSLHGLNSAWYWLRMPTLQESATVPSYFVTEANRYFRAGFPFGTQKGLILSDDTDWRLWTYLRYWRGLSLGLTYNGAKPGFQGTAANSISDLTHIVDSWLSPNPWEQQDAYSGQLAVALYPDRNGGSFNDRGSAAKSLTQDVILTNVLSFDVKVWNQNYDAGSGQSSPGFVDLGSYFINNNVISNEATDFRTSGNYGGAWDTVNNRSLNVVPLYQQNDQTSTSPFTNLIHPFMPAVFDTWTEEYEKNFLSETHPGLNADGQPFTFTGASSRRGFTVGDIPLDGEVTSADLPDFPPPYEAEIKALQVELRVFDPVSRTIKNSTVEVRFDR